ncbi:MAG: acyl-CoA dehydrogenase family protein [Alphaproteobacteria bacterium]|nr:acyl-CoA dehydrogenase family protein [Alphaproteobacteria bacterium]
MSEPIPELLPRCREALAAAEDVLDAARRAVAARVLSGGRIDPPALDANQHAAHGFAWLATTVEALRALLAWAERPGASAGALEALMLQAGFGEYLAQMAGGIAMAQGEFARPADLGLGDGDLAPLRRPGPLLLMRAGNTPEVRAAIAARIAADGFADPGADDETLAMMRSEMRAFADEAIGPHAHSWHRDDVLIPDATVARMAALGVFGLTIPEEYGGSGLGKRAMCVVSEELSRGFLGAGSLGTRAEIAGELIGQAGTADQKARFLPGIASGAILPTAVFTEPEAGSDLGAIRTRAVREGDTYRVYGAKTWITHAARSDLMTLLVRTDPASRDHRGLSMLLAEKPRGTPDRPFPAPGMSGGEITVIGYRGMKEYELAFDGFAVPAANLLGGVENQGFKQLMATFESARIQTAARAVGVAQNALDLALAYAQERRQFGRPIAGFQRVSGKLGWMAVETMLARLLADRAARAKDEGRRCDIEAGMAKLLAARVAWANADNAVQIHGGAGYAAEHPASRVLVDARILNIFEGAAEIQAQVIARGLLERRN